MSKGFNKNDPKHMGFLGLHIMGINDMPPEKWLSYFKTDEMKQIALEDEQGFIARLPPYLQEKARDLLQGVEVLDHQDPVPTSTISHAGISNQTTIRGTRPPEPLVVKETVVTDKGIYISVDHLRDKLSAVYKMESFLSAFYKAVELSGFSLDVEYISAAAKKKLLSNMKVAMVSEIESIVDNV